MKKFFFGLSVLLAAVGSAAEPAKVTMKSEVLARDMSFSILLPAAYKTEPNKRFPVIYFLDGWGGNGMGLFYNNAINQRPFIQNFADDKQVIVVNFGLPADWYFDAPLDPKLKFGTFLTTELIDHVDKNFRTIAKREGRAIAGISSGAHGAFLLAFQNPELYIAAGSLAGCPDLTHYIGSRPDWKLPHAMGLHKDHPDNWAACSIEPHLKNIQGKGLGVWFGCGLSDELNADNRKLEQQMKALGIAYTYHEAPGGHNGQYLAPAFQICMTALEKHLQH